MFVAELEDRIIGFVAVTFDIKNKVGEISLNAVHPEFAGRGIGTTLYTFALTRMKEKGMKVATVGVGGDTAHATGAAILRKGGISAFYSQPLDVPALEINVSRPFPETRVFPR